MSGDITMIQVVEALRDVYTDDGVAVFLASSAVMWDGIPGIVVCKTAEGRKRVWEWACGATGMVAT
jgi:hypothetical protein